MPELPDVIAYVEGLERRVLGQRIDQVRLLSPFVLRTAVPPVDEVIGKKVTGVRRLGKRIVLVLDANLFIVIHLMVAGRLRWLALEKKAPAIALVIFKFPSGSLVFTEAGTRKRASLHIVEGEASLAAFDMGGIDVMRCSAAEFRDRLTAANHTLKRALTDPRLFSGIGNAYSDEILHRARLSPIALTQKLKTDEVEILFNATRVVLGEWIERMREQIGQGFPEKVTAFRPEMAVHGRFGLPCPACGAPVQRIVYADNETNYCAACQTGGKLLADRSLSRLLKSSWPRSIDELG